MYEDFYKLVKDIKMPVWKDKVIYSAFLFITLFTFLSKDISVPLNTEAYPVKEIEFIKINKIKRKSSDKFRTWKLCLLQTISAKSYIYGWTI